MRDRSRAGWAALVCLLPVAGGCSSSMSPSGFLPDADSARSAVRGGWIALQESGAKTRSGLTGEFLAEDRDSLYILNEDGFRSVAKASLEEATVWGYDPRFGGLTLWTTLGTLSTISHGWLLGLSMPTWIVGGSIVTGSQSRVSRIRWPQQPWSDLRPFARYPQGLPADLARESLRFP